MSDSEDDKVPAEALNKSIEGSPVNFSCCFGLVLVFEIRVLESWVALSLRCSQGRC